MDWGVRPNPTSARTDSAFTRATNDLFWILTVHKDLPGFGGGDILRFLGWNNILKCTSFCVEAIASDLQISWSPPPPHQPQLPAWRHWPAIKAPSTLLGIEMIHWRGGMILWFIGWWFVWQLSQISAHGHKSDSSNDLLSISEWGLAIPKQFFLKKADQLE